MKCSHIAASLVGWCIVGGGVLAAAPPVQAGVVPFDTFLQFGFEVSGSAATGCFPDDVAGSFCIPSSGTPSQFLDAPAWTFSGPAQLTVTDAYESGDRFQIFDGGLLVGSTSAATPGADCGDDPLVCLSTAGMSQGSFSLGAGAHSLTLVAIESNGGGSAYLRLAGANAVPEPAALLLCLTALAGGGLARITRPTRPAQRGEPR